MSVDPRWPWPAGGTLWVDEPTVAVARLLGDGVTGATCGPGAARAAASSGRYDDLLDGIDPPHRAAALSVAHGRAVADALLETHHRSGGAAGVGWVSVDARSGSPEPLEGPIPGAAGPRAVVAATRRVAEQLDRPNALVEIVGTAELLPAVTELVAVGVPVNVTVVGFDSFAATLAAVLAGLENRGDPGRTPTAVSVVLSELDTEVDKQLWRRGSDASGGLRGRFALATASRCHHELVTVTGGTRWRALAAAGARPPLVVWRSTLARDPYYADAIYLDAVAGPGVASALPERLLERFRRGETAGAASEPNRSLPGDVTLESFTGLGVDIAAAAAAGLALWLRRRNAAWRTLEEELERRYRAAG